METLLHLGFWKMIMYSSLVFMGMAVVCVVIVAAAWYIVTNMED